MEKRIDVIVNACVDLDHVYLAIVGNGPTANDYVKLHGKENKIYCQPEFLSHEELAEIYASADLHVSASEFETLGNTVLESFSCGTPVVVPRTQGFMDTVSHDVNGFLFQPGNVSEARRFIRMLQDDHTLRSQFGRNALKSVADKTISSVIDDLLLWYANGQLKRRSRSYVRCLIVLLNLAWAVPLCIASLGTYDLIMAVLGKHQ